MGFLSEVKKGKIELPHLILLYGPDGVGKSTFAADAPNPIFMGTEKGTANLDVARGPTPKSFDDVIKGIDELTNEKHDFETLAIDSLDWLEPMVWDQVCKEANAANIEDVGGGYGKGYTIANKKWIQMISKLGDLREKRNMNIILIAHSMVRTFQDPTLNAGYDRYQLKLNEKSAAIFREFVDTVLFANYETFARKEKGNMKSKAEGDGARVVHTERRPAFDAKNRLGLPFQMPLSWDAYISGAKVGAPEDVDSIKARIDELKKMAPANVKKQVDGFLKQAGNSAVNLLKIENKLKTVVAA